jgi:hypothetical protein
MQKKETNAVLCSDLVDLHGIRKRMDLKESEGWETKVAAESPSGSTRARRRCGSSPELEVTPVSHLYQSTKHKGCSKS